MDQKSSPRDILMHILNIAVLYVSTFSLLTLLFSYIDLAFPDPLNPAYGAATAIRWALSSLIVLFIVFLWTSRFLIRDIGANPWKVDLKIRKWLLYLTLFLASVLIIGDLVTLIYNFLEGELTWRFILKILSVLIVAAGIFWYYLYDLRRSALEFAPKARVFSWTAIAIVVVIAIYGFYSAGSPFAQRLVRFDNQKINHLEIIQGQTVNFWQNKNRLPDSLDELKDNISGFTPPKDPQTQSPYIYRKTGDLSFELCAVFNAASEGKDRASFAAPLGIYPDMASNWNHVAGETCFSRVIDPDIYRKPGVPVKL